ncbi:MAG TPA: hypothetical protein VF482_03460 [Trebonia sp.]
MRVAVGGPGGGQRPDRVGVVAQFTQDCVGVGIGAVGRSRDGVGGSRPVDQHGLPAQGVVGRFITLLGQDGPD